MLRAAAREPAMARLRVVTLRFADGLRASERHLEEAPATNGRGAGQGLVKPRGSWSQNILRNSSAAASVANKASRLTCRCNGRLAATPVRFAAASRRHGAAELQS